MLYISGPEFNMTAYVAKNDRAVLPKSYEETQVSQTRRITHDSILGKLELVDRPYRLQTEASTKPLQLNIQMNIHFDIRHSYFDIQVQ